VWAVMIRWYALSEWECDQSMKQHSARCTVSIDAAIRAFVEMCVCPLPAEALGFGSPHIPIRST